MTNAPARNRRRAAWIMKGAATALATMVVIGLGIAGSAEAAPAAAEPSTAIVPVGGPAWDPGTASGTQCFYEVPDCVSSDPTAVFDIVSIGDTTSCTFTADVGWGDGKTSSKSYSGGPDGSVLTQFRHTYDKTDVYTIAWSAVVDSGSCFNTSGTLQFTLFPCPPGRTGIALPPVDAPVAIVGKPFSFSYGRLPLTFTTVRADLILSARHNRTPARCPWSSTPGTCARSSSGTASRPRTSTSFRPTIPALTCPPVTSAG